jgi:hypothetical protein
LGHTHLAGGPGVYHSGAILGNGSHAELGIARGAQLAHSQDVQGGVERARYLDADRHTAARKRDDHRPLLREGQKLGGQTATRIVTIEKLHCMIISGRPAWRLRETPRARRGGLLKIAGAPPPWAQPRGLWLR